MTSSAGPVEHPSYTAELARAEPGRSVRKAAGRVGRSRLLDGVLGFLSVPYAVLCVVLMIAGMLPLLAFFLLMIRREKAVNRSTEGGGSLTAVKTLNGRAVEGQDLAVLDELRYQELLARYMPEDSRGRTLGACGDFGCFLLAAVR